MNQYFGMQQILPELENKQAVLLFLLSGFTETEYEPAVFVGILTRINWALFWKISLEMCQVVTPLRV